MRLRVTVAGQVGIEVDGLAVELSGMGRVGRLFLAYLVCERHRPVPRDELADVLWDDNLPGSWEQMLRGNAAKTRKALAAAGLDPLGALRSAYGAYQIHLPPDAVVDVEEAASAVERAAAAIRAGRAEEALREAGNAIAVVAQGFLPGWSGIWVERRQTELQELRLQGLEVFAQAAAACGRWAEAVAAAEEAITLQPFRESAYRVLIAAHAGAGHRGEALRAYERCRRTLVEELGVSPSAETEDAYLAVLSDEPEQAPIEATPLPLPAVLDATPDSFLVGRSAESERLTAALKRAATGGRQAVIVGGEPGIGKTALVAHLARKAHAGGAKVLYGRCSEELSVAYQPFVEALGPYVASCRLSELAAHVATYGSELSRITPELARRLPETPPPLVTSPEADRHRLFEAISAVLTQASESEVLVLVLDDLHWAGLPTLLLLRHLMRARTASLLVVGTYRHTEVGPDHPLAATLADLRREPGVERILLEGLDEDGVSSFVERVEGHELDAQGFALARALHARTAGNPFFVGEFLRHLAEAGAVYRKAGSWSFYQDAEGLGLPEGVRDVVARRLGRLSKPANQVLTFASVVGVEFDLQLLERLADPDSTLDALDEAVAARVVTELGSGQYQFAHALVRETIYSGLTTTRRSRLHHRVGQALASLPVEAARHFPALAYHFAEAAADGGGLLAGDYAVAAAHQAIAQVAWEDAASYVNLGLRALTLTDPTHLERRFDLLLIEAETLMVMVKNERAKDALLAAAESARLLVSPARLAQAVSPLLFNFGFDRRSAQLGEEALAQLGDSEPGLRARLLAGLALSPKHRDDRLSEPETRAALELARHSGDAEAVHAALVARTMVLAETEHARERLAMEEELVALGPVSGPVTGTRWMHSLGRGRAMARLVLGDRDGFESDVDVLETRWLDLQSRGLEWQVALWRATSALLDGRFDEVAGLASSTLAVVPDSDHGLEPWAVQMCKLALERGRAGEFQSEVVRVLTLRPRNLTLAWMLAFTDTEIGSHDIARQLVEQRAADEHVDMTRQPHTSVSLAYLAEVVTALGDVERATKVYEMFLPFSGLAVASGMVAHCPGAVDRYLGQLAATLGRWDEAEAHYLAALDLEAGLKSPPLLARTRYWYGRMLVERGRQGDAERAHHQLGSALEGADRLGMARLAAQISELA